jgi:hypothetical protein
MSDNLGNLNPKFWYLNEEGKISKCIYCKLCHAGPFKKSDKKINFDFYGTGDKDPYCTTCASALNFFQSSASPKNHKKPEALKWDQKQQFPKSPFKEEPQELDIPELD